MKRFFSALVILVFLIGSVSVSMAGKRYYRSPHYGHSYGYKYHHYGNRYHRYRHHHADDALAGLVVGVLVGGVLVSALATASQPRTVYAPPPAPMYQTRVCFQNRRVSGEWQQGSYGGPMVWVEFPYPLIRRVQVPCN
ncbi:hypothetical protein [Desulfosediminicola sp.]|uniref:hypothetical protein n=1 Tax=Desulfosediminicola sp. TaxID=2886825 RepID=UPI003AF23DAB